MDDHLTIGKMARINGVTEQTLRLYDRIKLLEPCEINAETGYRYYNIKQCAQLDMIMYLKALGISLTEIKECFKEGKVDKLQKTLEEHKSDIESQMQELAYTQKAIERALENFRRYNALPQEETIVQEYQKARRIFVHDTKTNLYSYGMEYYEKVLRSIKENYILHHLPESYFCNVGSIMRREHFVKTELYATEAVLFVDDSFEGKEGIEMIPEAVFLCTYCNGYPKEEECLVMLMEYIKANDYEVIGDCISEILIEFPIFTHYDRNALFKLQIPVKAGKS
ncbi:MAG: helix-turn-helix domain-containing protein [Clostridiales bacterium]|nr:helix-turn-helix domain-containing protein [Clostridiales bacterium]